MIGDDLLKKLERNVLNPYHDMDTEHFSEELDFVRQTALELEGTGVSIGSRSLEVSVKVTHAKPKAMFDSVIGTGKHQPSCEIADLLFVFQRETNGSIQNRRAMLSQAKFEPSAADADDQFWNINMRQLEFLNKLPPFSLISTTDYGSFDLEPNSKTFGTYSFASTFRMPFYYSADRVFSQDNLANCDFTQRTSRFRPDDFVSFDYSPSVLKRFLKGYLGEDLNETDDDVREFIDVLYDYVENDRSFDAMFADGGRQTELSPANFEFAIIQFTLSDEAESEQFES